MIEPPVARSRRVAVLAAARDIAAEQGAAAVDHSELARRSGASATALKRLWPTRVDLLLGAVLPPAEPALPDPDDDLRVSLIKFLSRLLPVMSDPPATAAVTLLLVAADADADASARIAAIVHDRLDELETLLAGTGRRVDADDFCLLIGPMFFKHFVAQQDVDVAFIEYTVGSWLSSPVAARNRSSWQAVAVGGRARAIAVIAAQHSHADLTPSAVAQALGMSVRHLYTLFESDSVGVAGRIQAARLAAATDLLRATTTQLMSIAEVARISGFGGTSQFGRVFRAAYGMTATQFRAGAARGEPPIDYSAIAATDSSQRRSADSGSSA